MPAATGNGLRATSRTSRRRSVLNLSRPAHSSRRSAGVAIPRACFTPLGRGSGESRSGWRSGWRRWSTISTWTVPLSRRETGGQACGENRGSEARSQADGEACCETGGQARGENRSREARSQAGGEACGETGGQACGENRSREARRQAGSEACRETDGQARGENRSREARSQASCEACGETGGQAPPARSVTPPPAARRPTPPLARAGSTADRRRADSNDATCRRHSTEYTATEGKAGIPYRERDRRTMRRLGLTKKCSGFRLPSGLSIGNFQCRPSLYCRSPPPCCRCYWPAVLADSGACLAALVAVLGAVSLAGIAGAARSALRSRRCLLLWFELGRRLLPCLLLAQIGLLALALACAGTFEILGLWRVGQVPVSEGRTQLSVALILLGLLASAWQTGGPGAPGPAVRATGGGLAAGAQS